MAAVPPVSLPLWFRVAASVALVWNVFGVVMYLSSVGVFGDPMAGLTETERAAAASIPGWMDAAVHDRLTCFADRA